MKKAGLPYGGELDLKYELKPGVDWIAFLRLVDSCVGEVEYEGRNGDRLNLKSQLSKYLFLTVKPDEASLAGSWIHCSAEDGSVLSGFLVIKE